MIWLHVVYPLCRTELWWEDVDHKVPPFFVSMIQLTYSNIFTSANCLPATVAVAADW
jgi:hypothetical protein